MVGEIVLFGLWLVAGWAFNRHAKRMDIEISKLQRENASCAKAAGIALNRANESKEEAKKSLALSSDHAVLCADFEARLTAVDVAPKSSEGKSRTRTVPFRAWRAAAEMQETASIRTAAEVSKEE